MSSKEQPIKVSGTVIEVLPGMIFRVELPNGHVVLGHVAGKVRKTFTPFVVGDRVQLELSVYDLRNALIVVEA